MKNFKPTSGLISLFLLTLATQIHPSPELSYKNRTLSAAIAVDSKLMHYARAIRKFPGKHPRVTEVIAMLIVLFDLTAHPQGK